MTIMLEKTYRALIAAGAPEKEAGEAASELASYESRFTAVEQKLTALQGTVNLLTWMVGFSIAIGVATLYRVFA